MEAAINHVMVHKTILGDLKLEDQVKAIKALVVVKKASLSRFNNTIKVASTANKEALHDAIKELKGNQDSLQASGGFQPF